MSRNTVLFVIAALVVISTVAEAADAAGIGRYSAPNPAFKTWNNCPPNYTVQDGVCKPYRGR